MIDLLIVITVVYVINVLWISTTTVRIFHFI